MIQQNVRRTKTNVKRELGYYFLPKQYDNAPGHPRLNVVLSSTPTGEHFDPEHVIYTVCAVANRDRGIEHLIVHHNWLGKRVYRVCAGFVRLTDRRGKSVEAYSFGGELQIRAGRDKTIAKLTSSAPILELSQINMHCMADLLATEVEVLLARRRAAWIHRDLVDYERRLAAVEPQVLYRSCIEALKARSQNCLHDGDMNTLNAFKRFLTAESEHLAQRMSEPSRSLEDIL
jgi:hypothetical protein